MKTLIHPQPLNLNTTAVHAHTPSEHLAGNRLNMAHARQAPYATVTRRVHKAASLIVAAALLMCLAAPAAMAQQPERFDVDVFARVPNPPGLPEGIATESGTVYVATNPGGNAPTGPQFGKQSKVFAYSSDGEIKRAYVIEGQNMSSTTMPAYGLQALAFDRQDMLYVIDKAPARIVQLNPRTGRQRDYVRFPNLPTCRSTTNQQRCSATAEDLRPFPNYLAFARDGSLYVSDFQQALIWRVPPGGGRAEVAFTSRRLDSGMGPNGVQLMRDGETLVFAQTQTPGAAAGVGKIYTLRIRQSGRLDRLRTLYESQPGDGPDGFAIARSGNIYLNLFLSNQVVVISPEGREVTRIVTQSDQAIPFDSPASAAFVGKRLLVTNQAVNTRNPNSFAILTIFAGEPGLPLFRPSIGRSDK